MLPSFSNTFGRSILRPLAIRASPRFLAATYQPPRWFSDVAASLPGAVSEDGNLTLKPAGVQVVGGQGQRNIPTALRLTVDSGGCGGFQYYFDLVPADTATGTDIKVEADDGSVVMLVDALSQSYLENCKVDFVEEMIGSKFVNMFARRRGEFESRPLMGDVDETVVRIMGESVEVDDDCDYVLVMPIRVPSGREDPVEWNSTVKDANAEARKIFKRRGDTVSDFDIDSSFPKGSMSLLELSKKIRQKLLDLLRGSEFGLHLDTLVSIDKDEVFLKLRITDEAVRQLAASEGYRMPLRAGAKYKPPINPRSKEPVPAYAEYFSTRSSDTIFEDFRQVDRIRLILRRLQLFVDVTELVRLQIIHHGFPVHKHLDVQELSSDWAEVANFWKIPCHKYDNDIRNYFGEEVAFLFTWLAFYTRGLCLPALIGGLLFFRREQFTGWSLTVQREVQIGYAVFMACWAAFFHEFFRRKQARNVQLWGMKNYDSVESVLPSFDETMSEKTTYIRKLISVLTMALFLFFIVGGITWIQWFRYNLLTSPDDYLLTRLFGADRAAEIAATMITMQIKVFDALWDKTSKWLTDRENHKTKSQWKNSMVIKSFMVKFFNSFYPFLYVAFAKQFVDGCPADETGCMPELQKNLAVFFVVHTATVLSKTMMVVLSTKKAVRDEIRAVHRLGDSSSRYTYLQLQAKTNSYGGTSEDYLESSVQFGFVTCFSVVLPPIALLALLSNFIKYRLMAYRQCKILRRSYPAASEGIGAWSGLFGAISSLAVLVNCGLVVFVMQPAKGFDLQTQLALFLLFEHVLFFLKLIVDLAVPDVPYDVDVCEEQNIESMPLALGGADVQPVR
ncbi:Anoctamin [Perkinsus chesapeaki]|uniref:Anoctamin n=1 Tax=Perkinsus chesapeaki TaxID=330153 RepID=A0A7J6M7W9_PERCH|nr:Anoctamin [Perkinsus chesapeaki]